MELGCIKLSNSMSALEYFPTSNDCNRHVFLLHYILETRANGMNSIDKHSWYFKVLYQFGHVLGLNPLRLRSDDTLETSVLASFYTLVQTLFFGITCVKVFIDRCQWTFQSETEVFYFLDQCMVVMKFVEISTCWFSFGFFQNRLIRVIGHFNTIHVVEHKAEIFWDYSECLKRYTIFLLCFHLVFLLSVVNAMVIGVKEIADADTIWWCIYHTIRVITYDVIFLFVCATLIVKEKFRRLNEQLQNFSEHCGVRDEEDNWNIAAK